MENNEMKNNEQNQKNTKNNVKNEQKMQKKQQKHEKSGKKGLRGAVIGLAISTGILGATSLGLGIAYGITQSQANEYSLQLDSVYKRNYYELVDNVNNADMKISKLLASSSENYQAKMLGEIADASKDMQFNIAALPLSNDNIVQSVRFINQMSGYTQVLEEKLNKGGALTESDLSTLREMHKSLSEMKEYLNQMSEKILMGYSIVEASSHANGEIDDFTVNFSGIKTTDTDYPSMIYDGPFSDSVVNQKIVGLKGSEVSKDEAYQKVDKTFKNLSGINFEGETDGKFNTYNFSIKNSDQKRLYVQVTKIGGNILTVSGNVASDIQNIELDQAEKIALNFAKENGIEKPAVVWHEMLNSQAFFNITPTENGVVLYPDLVKVKVDMEKGDVIGYDAIAYFTNHTKRTLGAPKFEAENLKANIDTSFDIKGSRLVLAPLDYNRQVLCYEFVCERDGATYYIYFNANDGTEENILKVVETSDSSKLM